MKTLLAGFLLLLAATSAVAQQAAAQSPAGTPSTATREFEVPLRTWQGIPGLERTPKGRVFVSWFTGGPKEPAPENTVLLCYSDDGGATFTPPQGMAGPQGGSRAFDPTLWIDPLGRLWYIFNRGNKDAAVHDVHARICEDPEATPPVFGAEFRVGYDAPYSFRMNKPTVLSTGEWIMPVTHAAEPIHEWFAGPKQLQGVGISTDQGKSWKLHGSLQAPNWALECMIIELRDGRLRLLTRTGGGFLWESYSTDRGRTWSAAQASKIANPGSRFFIRRLSSGNLLVNHYKFKGRSHLTAQLSTDDGANWNEGLLLDERSGVSYPDGVQDADGLIWIIYDRDRKGAGEILLAKFREADVAAGKDVSGAVSLKRVVDKLSNSSANTTQTAPPPVRFPFDARRARAAQEAWASHLGLPVESKNSLQIKLVIIPPGEFPMGSTDAQVDQALKWSDSLRIDENTRNRIRATERPQHKVTIERPFLLATTEVTIGQFRQFVAETKYVTEAEVFGNANGAGPSPSEQAEKNGFDWRNPGYAQIEEDAVSQVTWNDAVVFCNWLSSREKFRPSYERTEKTGWRLLQNADGYRLPTEAQWEYACRAGTTTQYSFGDDPGELEKYGWFLLKSGSNPVRKVGSKPANPFGLYDMHGNLFEWCEDFYEPRRYDDPAGENIGSVSDDPPRVLRGGDWYGNALRCRSAFRGYGAQSTRSDDVGFRLMRPL